MQDWIPIVDGGSSSRDEARDKNPRIVLIVDDDPEVLEVTKFALKDAIVLDRPLRLVYASSAEKAKAMLDGLHDVAVAIVDVVMETEIAGLELVKYMRESLGMSECRIILRTGQPGFAPELDVIREYDINDYRTKSELTRTRLLTSVIAAIRSYEQLLALSEYRQGLETIVRGSAELLEKKTLGELAEGALEQLGRVLATKPRAIAIAKNERGSEGPVPTLLAAAGTIFGLPGGRLSELVDARTVALIAECLERGGRVNGDAGVAYGARSTDGSNGAVYIDSPGKFSETDLRLLDVFMVNIAACCRKAELVDKLNHAAYHDHLTTLANRLGLIASIDEREAAGEAAALALIDLEHFTDVNDGLGLEFGDSVLKAVGRRLMDRFDGNVSLARLGADLFGAVGPEAQLSQSRVSAAFEPPFVVDGYQVPFKFKAGIAAWSGEALGGHRVLRQAGIALNRAKKRRGPTFCSFEPEMEVEIQRHVAIISELRDAFKAGELEIWFQPQVRVRDALPVGAEALVRWPKGGGFAYSPEEFVPLAEHSGLILDIGAWALDEACLMAVRVETPELRDFRFAVNVSVLQFRQPDFVDAVSTCLARYGVDPKRLELEVTESVAADDPEEMRAKLSRLRDMGVQIAIDDFGTGYSSLGQLLALPVDYLKIDRSFVRDIESGKARQVAESIVNLSKELGVKTIAEGIETEGQAETLASLGCDYAQGYYFGKPMPAERFIQWISNAAKRSPGGPYDERC